MGADKGGKLGGRESLVQEELEKAVMVGTLAESWRHGVVWGCGAAVSAADDRLDFRATRACNDRNTMGASLAEVMEACTLSLTTHLEANWIKSAAPTVEPNCFR